MKRLLIIAVLIGSTVAVAEAQLLEDTDRKLKSSKVERRGFLFFSTKKKVKKSDGIPSADGRRSPRYSSISSPFKIGPVGSPRYSGTKDKVKRYAIGARYSAGGVAKFKTRTYSPRLSKGNPFRGSRYAANPRLSRGNPFRGAAYNVSPRYSAGNPLTGLGLRYAPRYSKGNPLTGLGLRYAPRYSKGIPFSGKDQKISPRYSSGNPLTGLGLRYAPRYSKGIPFSGKDQKISPRYSKGNPFRGVKYKTDPRYSGGKVTFFKQVGNRELSIVNYYHYTSQWEGDIKVKRKRLVGDQHPSSNYNYAMKFSNPNVREALRKWNIFWIRLNGNKQFSKGVKEKVGKPKFDKKERVIWNN